MKGSEKKESNQANEKKKQEFIHRQTRRPLVSYDTEPHLCVYVCVCMYMCVK